MYQSAATRLSLKTYTGYFHAARLIGLATILLVLGVLAAQAAPGGQRIALIIGNGRYQNVQTLANPTNDSIAMRGALEKLGFTIYGGDDLDLSELRSTIAEFRQAAEKADTVLFYYSGHAFQLRGRNYLVPVDAKLKAVSSIEAETVRLDWVIEELQDSRRQTLIFLDACRNNPLPPSQRTNDGLAQVESAGNDLFVAFATQPGNISYDGNGKLSPFTKAIAKHISTPAQGISDLMIQVRNDVEKLTLGQQTPWEQTSLKKQFYFNPRSVQLPNEKIASLDLGVPGSELSSTDRSAQINDDVSRALSGDQPNLITVPGIGNTSPNVIFLPEAPIELFGKEDLILGVQSELQRVGCYNGEPDGIWSDSSKDALGRYYKVRKTLRQEGEPNEFLLELLKRERGMVCLAPVVRRPPIASVPRAERPKASRRASSETRSAPPVASAAPKARTITNTRVLGAFR